MRVRFNEFQLDEPNASLLHRGKPVALAPTPFALLCALARQPGTLLTKHALLDEVWGHQFVTDSVLKTAISDLRTVLNDDPRQPRFIETVSRRGYRFIAVPTAVPPVVAGAQGNVVAAGRQAEPWFIGRTEEVARLHRLWEGVLGGKRAVVWVAGEPGIGKTTLIEHFVADLGDVACARGQCVDLYGAGEPYLPVLEALADLCRRDSEVPALLRAFAPTWLLQLPWLSTAEEREALGRELVGVGPDRMLREMGQLLDRYTELRPLLLVTEDLHWSDRATIQLIDYVARRRSGARVMWLASFRLAEVVALDHPLNPMRHELRLHKLCEEIVLDPFSEAEVADYVAERSPSKAGDESFVRALHGRTDGVPLFVASVMTEAMTRIESADDVGEARAVPENLAALIDHYIAKLGDEQRAMLSAAATCGSEFRVGTVALALERDAAWVAQTCEELARTQLWLRRAEQADETSEPTYLFRHALFRQVLYERTAAALRGQLHRKIGTALEQERAAGLAVTAAELAMHFERAREPLRALRYYAEAAEAALLHLSPGECMNLTERAVRLLDLAGKGSERDSLDIDLSTLRGLAAFHLLGVGNEAKEAFERAYVLFDQNPQHPRRTELLHNFGFLRCLRAEYGEALALAERTHALASDTNDPVLQLAACTVQANVFLLQGRPQDARALIESVLPVLEPIDVGPAHSFAQVTLLGLLAVHLLHLGLVQQARARMRQAYDRAAQLGQPMGKMVAIWCDALMEIRFGNSDGVSGLADDLRALVEESDLGHGRAAWRWFSGWAEARKGEPRKGLGRIREGYEDNTRLGMLAGGSETLGYAAEALMLAGDIDGAQHQLEQALQLVSAHGERVYLPQLLLIEAAIARARGQPAAALASVRRAIKEARAQQAAWLELLALVELCEHGGAKATDRQALAALVERLHEAAETDAVARARGLIRGSRSATT
ncbi:MAG TPA: AAA family ATPase [Burkholderiaceae bacterium]|nr:AAA family ATPase [Burkholderiaceae bacterium]